MRPTRLVVAVVLGSVGGVRPHDLLPIACVGIADAAANGTFAQASTGGLLAYAVADALAQAGACPAGSRWRWRSSTAA